MFCSNCGKEISDHAKFCAYCGSPVQTAKDLLPPTPEKSTPPIPKKTILPILIGVISIVVLTVAVVVGGMLYVTSRDNVDAEQTSVSTEKDNKDKDAQKKDAFPDKTEEKEEVPAAPETAKLLQKYLETELIPQYGTANLGTQIKTIDYNETYDNEAYYEENLFWTASSGLSNAKIYDFDQDGYEELLVFLLTEKDISLCIYEAGEEEIQQTAEYTRERFSDLDGLDLSWSLLTVNETPYLFFHEKGYGLIGDFSTTNAGLYRYDGHQLYAPLLITQTQGGSSDFIYTAYQYNADGELLNEEIVLDEDMEHESDCTPEHYYQRVAELFATYGIYLDSNASIQQGKDIYRNITHSDEYEPLLHLQMDADYFYQDNSPLIMYHFNDFDSPWAFCRRFLSGEETVQMRKDAWYNGDLQKKWTVDDILAEIENEYGFIPSIQYAYLDCGGDGVEEIAIRFVGLGIYDPGDDSDLIMIITCNDKAPEVVYSCESWARSYTSPLYHGCIPSSGSAGAGDHPFDLHYLDENGDLHTVYDAEALGGWWIRDINSDIYDTVFASSEPSADVIHYQINEADYYVMHSYDTSIDSQCEEYVSLGEQNGMHFVSEEEIGELIKQRAEELGIEYDWMSEEELSWNDWWG